jgi:hypothetical protein
MHVDVHVLWVCERSNVCSVCAKGAQGGILGGWGARMGKLCSLAYSRILLHVTIAVKLRCKLCAAWVRQRIRIAMDRGIACQVDMGSRARRRCMLSLLDVWVGGDVSRVDVRCCGRVRSWVAGCVRERLTLM